MRQMFSGGDSVRWILRWKDHREIYPSFAAAKADLLDMFWWWSREFIDADPQLADDIMAAWSEVASEWNFATYSGSNYFETKVRGDLYTCVRFGKEEEYGNN